MIPKVGGRGAKVACLLFSTVFRVVPFLGSDRGMQTFYPKTWRMILEKKRKNKAKFYF